MKLAAVGPFAAVPSQDEPPEFAAKELQEESKAVNAINTSLHSDDTEDNSSDKSPSGFIRMEDYFSQTDTKSEFTARVSPWRGYFSRLSVAARTYKKVDAQLNEGEAPGHLMSVSV